ncbi:MAG: phosphotransferase enzyme family protein, partial [Candidatus Thorarchaeota archaeon]
MMRVNNMRLVVDKIYQEKPTAMNEMIKLWSGEIKQVDFIRASSNFVFKIIYNGKEKFLRFSHETDKAKASIEAEMDFILYLHEQGLSIALPNLSQNNNYVETVETEDGKFNGVLFDKANGVYINEEDLTLQHFFKWGEVSAKIHLASKDFQPNSQRKRQTWVEEIHQANQMFAEKDAHIKQELENLTNWIKSLHLTKENYGLIHYDLCTDNIFWQDYQPCLIDFDDAAYYPFTAD